MLKEAWWSTNYPFDLPKHLNYFNSLKVIYKQQR